ncbi:MAG: VWA domain-containing protein [Acidobacteriota bacterium]
MNKNHLLAAILITQLVTATFAQRPPLERPPSPQQTPPPRPQQAPKTDEDDVVRITTNLVQIDAIITDKNGKPVTDLKSDEVEILEDGKSQKITNFSYVVAEAPAVKTEVAKKTNADKNAPPIPPSRLKPEDVRRTIAVVVDDLSLSFESTYYVRSALKKFVDEQLAPGDLVAIIRTSGGMGALQQFTSDKRQLYAAIERVRWFASGRGGIGAFAPLTGAMPGVDDRGTDDPSIVHEDLDRFREDVLSVGTLGAIGYVVRGLRELPGRKSVLLVSDGFRLFDRNNLGRTQRVLQALRLLTDQANRASVTIYTMDARGLQTLGLTAADSTSGMRPDQVAQQLAERSSQFSESQDGLIVLAQQTGGLAIRNNNDLAGGIRKVLEDQRGYYLIGYRPDQSTFDLRTGRRVFHRLSLKVTRPGKFTVRMRNGFFGVTDEETRPSETPVQRMIGALVSPFGASGVHLQLTSLFTNDLKAGSVMRSLLHIDAKDLSFTEEADGWHKSTFDILAVTFGDNGVPIDQVSKTHTVRTRGETYKRVMRDGFVYGVMVPVKKPGAYQLRIALRDSESERIGSASQFVDVPDLKKNRLAVSSIVLNGLTPAEYARTNGTPGQPPNGNAVATPPNQTAPAASQSEGVDEGDAQASPAVRRFRQGMVMQYGYLIFNAQLNKTTNQPQLMAQIRLVRDGKVVFTGKDLPVTSANQADLKRLVAGGALQLGTELPPGEYILQIIVTDVLAKEKYRVSTQWSDFEIVK